MTTTRTLEHSRIGSRLSHYQLLENLQGNMASVYKAVDVDLARPVVLKILPTSAADDEAKARFRREAKAASALDHKNICAIYSIETAGDEWLIAMPFYDGQTLGELIGEGRISLARSVDYARQIAEGLGSAHVKGIVHRDIKPSNIIVTSAGEVKILDFGIATIRGAPPLTKPGSVVGTPAFCAPEQLRGETLDARADLWSLGVLLYEMIAGRNPFQAEHLEGTIFKVLHEEPPPLTDFRADTPIWLESIVSKLLAKSPDRRYRSAEELLRDFSGAGAADGATPPGVNKPGTDSERESKDLAFGYVLLIDIVGFTKLPMDEGLKQVELLKKLVLETEEFGKSDQLRQLVPLDTGDGHALVFFGSPTSPVNCAIQLWRQLIEYPDLRVRMGIHFGPLYRRVDSRTNENVSGDAVNIAVRVANWGDARHILLSAEAAGVVGRLGQWRGNVHDIGDVTVKHGLRIRAFNFCSREYGNSRLPSKIRMRRLRNRVLLAAAILIVVVTLFLTRRPPSPSESVQQIFVRSAVVPVNLSLDDRPITTLTNLSPSTTIATSPGVHTLQFSSPSFQYDERIVLRSGDPVRLILVNEEFRKRLH